jgi:tRNA threonylcarbamoyladenosine biosynthesis protein TsaE
VTVQTSSEEQTMALAARIAEALRPGDVVTLDGPLGSGKTCFVRGLARGLGIDPAQVSSPTFIIRQEYEGQRVTLTHIDGYRIKGSDELDTIGWDELLDSGETIVAIEWPTRLDGAAADRVTLAVTFEHISAGQRELTIEWSEKDRRRFEKVFGYGEAEASE